MIDRETMLKVVSSVPFYACQLDKYDLKKKWSELPVIDKETVRNKQDLFLNKVKPSRIIQTKTSGSTGIILNIFWNKKDYDYSLFQLWRLRKRFGVLPNDIYGTDHAYVYDEFLNPVNHRIIFNNNYISFSKIDLNVENLKWYLECIINNNVRWLFLQPMFAYQLALINTQHCFKFPKLKFIELTGEMLEDKIKEKISDSFGVPVVNHYGMQEFNSIAYEDETGCLKCCEDNVFVEILDDFGNVLMPGCEGNIVVTTLTNSYMPLIRYNTKDRGIIFCKGQNRYLQLTNARTVGLLANNRKIYDPSVFFLLVEKINTYGYEIYNFRFLLKQNTLYCFFLSEKKFDIAKLEKTIENLLKEMFTISFNTIIVSPTFSGIKDRFNRKLQYFIDDDHS